MQDSNYWANRQRRRLLEQRLSRRRLIQLGAAGSAGAFLLAAGCGGGDSSRSSPSDVIPAGTPRPGGKITIASNAGLSSMDPAFWSLGGDKVVVYDIYDWPVTEGLDASGNLTIMPNLGESYEWVDDTHLIMHWRKGIKFHDDTDFNAEAVQRYYEYVMDPDKKSPRTAELRSLDRVEKVDDFTTRYVLKEPDYVIMGLTLSFWTSCFPSPTAVEKYGETDFTNHPVGTGPFMFKSQQPGASTELVRNPNYWRPGEPYLDGYSVKVIPDKAVAAASLKAGEIDMASTLDWRDVQGFQNDRDFNVVNNGAGVLKQIFINKNREYGGNPHVRRAISLAIDRQEFVERYAGFALITPGPFVKGTTLANPNEPDPGYDLQAAKQELAAGGYPDGFEIDQFYTTTEPDDQTDGQVLQAQLAKVGIKVNMAYVPIAQAGVRLITGDYEFAVGGWAGEGDDYGLRNVYESKGVFNGGTTTDPEIDRLIQAGKLEKDLNRRRELYWQLESVVMENNLFVYIVALPSMVVMSRRLQGFEPDLTVKDHPRMQFQWRQLWVSS